MPNQDFISVSQPTRFPDEIASVLMLRIEGGVYPPGSKLPSTRELASLFQVSPPIVREALSRLKYDGYIEPRQGSGVYIKDRTSTPSLRLGGGMETDKALLAEIYEVRLLVEKSCAELAAIRRKPEDLVRMRIELDAMQEAVKNRTDGSLADVRFHLAIAEATQNSTVVKLVKFLHGSLANSVKLARANSERVPGQPEKVQLEHEALFNGVAAADPVAAGNAVRTHLESAANRLGLGIGPEPTKKI